MLLSRAPINSLFNLFKVHLLGAHKTNSWLKKIVVDFSQILRCLRLEYTRETTVLPEWRGTTLLKQWQNCVDRWKSSTRSLNADQKSSGNTWPKAETHTSMHLDPLQVFSFCLKRCPLFSLKTFVFSSVRLVGRQNTPREFIHLPNMVCDAADDLFVSLFRRNKYKTGNEKKLCDSIYPEIYNPHLFCLPFFSATLRREKSWRVI